MLYTARKRLDPTCGESWTGYLDFLGRHDLTRVVTLDTILCPSVIDVDTREAWDVLAPNLSSMDFFVDLSFVRSAAAADHGRPMILAALREPGEADLRTCAGPAFEFAGFDIVDRFAEISALLNCGGFQDIFAVDELSASSGLLASRDRACHVRAELRRRYPDRDHTACDVWAVWMQCS